MQGYKNHKFSEDFLTKLENFKPNLRKFFNI